MTCGNSQEANRLASWLLASWLRYRTAIGRSVKPAVVPRILLVMQI